MGSSPAYRAAEREALMISGVMAGTFEAFACTPARDPHPGRSR